MITASGIERVMACPASAALPQARSTSEHAERGTAIHAFLAQAKTIGREIALAQVPEAWRPVCEAIDLDSLPTMLLGEASYAYDPATGKARFLGAGLNRDYSKALASEMVGTADVVGVAEGSTAFVADYKTGWGDITAAAQNPQLRFLALCVSLAYPDIDEVVVEVIRIREDGSAWRDTATLDTLDLVQVAREIGVLPSAVELVRATIAAGQTPNVSEGSWCKYCPSINVCPAKTSLLRIAAGGGDLSGPFLQGGLTRDMVGSAFVLAEQLDALSKELRKRVHGAMAEFGEVPTPRGTVLRKVLTDGNEKLDPEALFQIVVSMAGADVAEAALEKKATKKRLGEALRKAFGSAGAAKERAILNAARESGAISRSAYERLVEIDAKKGAA